MSLFFVKNSPFLSLIIKELINLSQIDKMELMQELNEYKD